MIETTLPAKFNVELRAEYKRRIVADGTPIVFIASLPGRILLGVI